MTATRRRGEDQQRHDDSVSPLARGRDHRSRRVEKSLGWRAQPGVRPDPRVLAPPDPERSERSCREADRNILRTLTLRSRFARHSISKNAPGRSGDAEASFDTALSGLLGMRAALGKLIPETTAGVSCRTGPRVAIRQASPGAKSPCICAAIRATAGSSACRSSRTNSRLTERAAAR